jgi:hypothetical protein
VASCNTNGFADHSAIVNSTDVDDSISLSDDFASALATIGDLDGNG